MRAGTYNCFEKKKKRMFLKGADIPFLWGAKNNPSHSLLLFLLFFFWTEESSPPFATTYLSQGQDELLSHHHNKLPRVCLLYQCTSHQECFPLFPVCIYSYGCLQGRKNTAKLSETVVKIFISHSPAELLFILLFSKAGLKPWVLWYERNRSCLLPFLFPETVVSQCESL